MVIGLTSSGLEGGALPVVAGRAGLRTLPETVDSGTCMSNQPMHDGEVPIDEALVLELLRSQFPGWADLPIRRVASAGTVNALYRLGNGMVVRLPRHERWIEDTEQLGRWLPVLAPQLPVAIPMPLAQGKPEHGYPFVWSVYGWIEGDAPPSDGSADSPQLAADIGGFVRSLQGADPTDAPEADRGSSLSQRDARTRRAIERLREQIDTEAVTATWEVSRAARPWDGGRRWIHGDLLPSNVLVQQGRLTGVLDFGGAGGGDPACDLMPAWSLLSRRTRPLFREAVGVDNDTWLRGRGWALSIALIILPYYRDTNPQLVAIAARIVDEILEDVR